MRRSLSYFLKRERRFFFYGFHYQCEGSSVELYAIGCRVVVKGEICLDIFLLGLGELVWIPQGEVSCNYLYGHG